MIDTKELRRLAQAATPGPWILLPVGDKSKCFAVADINFLSVLTVAYECGTNFGAVYLDGDAKFIAAANPAAVSELLDRLEVAEKERDELRAKIEEMEKQEPVAQVAVHKTGGNAGIAWSARPLNEFDSLPLLREGDRLYLAPGAQPAPSIPEGWLRAIDEALVVAHIGVANASDTYEQAKSKLDNLIGFHVDVATDPAVNGGWKLVPIEPMPSMPKLHVGYLPTLNQDGYPALGAWWVQLWDGDDVFARVYGSSPEEAHNRAEMLAAAPEAKP